MISVSARWHLERRATLLARYPDIAKLPRYNPISLIPIIFTPLCYLLLAYSCQYLTLIQTALLAFFIGSRCLFSFFKYSHELSHHLISARLSQKGTQRLLRYINILNLSTSVYLLFRFGHKPHHAGLGENSLSKAKRFLNERHPDIELLIDSYYFELALTPQSAPTARSPFIFNHQWIRLLAIALLYPLTSLLKGTFLFHLIFIVKYIKSCFTSQPKRYQKRLNDTLLQILILYLGLFFVYLAAGVNALCYMLISDLAQRGLLLHPLSTFILSSHKTWHKGEKIQPSTSSYSTFLTFILMKMNHHVEHHDFPDIPCRYLPKLRHIAPAFYTELKHFKGYREIIYTYFKSKHWFYGGQGTEVS